MARLSMNEMTTYRWSFEEDVQQYLAAGIGAIGVWRQKLSDYGEEKGADLLAESGLAVSSLLWAGGFTGSEGRTHAESIEDGRDAIRWAAALRAESLIVYTGSRAGHTHNHARRLLKTALKELCPLATECGVTLALKPMHSSCASEWTFLTDLDETLLLVDDIASPRLKLAFDTYHFGHNPLIVARLRELAPRIAIVQLGDAKQPPQGEQNRCCLGGGTIPLQAIVTNLINGGYNGFFDVELMGEDLEVANYHDLLVESKQIVEGLLAHAQE